MLDTLKQMILMQELKIEMIAPNDDKNDSTVEEITSDIKQ
jgi:hypothetical protein